MATNINISDITSNISVDNDYNVSGDGYFDDLMESVNKHLLAQYQANRITGDSYAKAYVSMMQSVLGQAIQFGLAKRSTEIRTDIAEEDYKKKLEDYQIMTATGVRQAKIDTILNQKDKSIAEKDYVLEQTQQLVNSINYNNKIKALDSLADTYGTYGAGGLTMSSDMWATYFSIVTDLSTVPAPTSTTVTKVT